MTDIQITRYDTTFKKEWDDFVSNSKNATFLLKRGYMERFSLYSLPRPATKRWSRIPALHMAA